MSGGWTPNMKLLAVDPGDVHVGVAEFLEQDDSWECVRAYELGHDEAADRITSLVIGGELDVLVVERFALYADKAKSQVGSEMETAQLIGVIKYIHRHYLGQWEKVHKKEGGGINMAALNEPPRCKTKLVFQPASIQKATRAVLRAKGVKSEAQGNDHAKSAELHGWHYIMKLEGL